MSYSDDGLISVRYDQTNDVYDALVHADNAMGQVISELEAVITQLLKSSWAGIASDAWQSIQQGWTDQIAQMNQDLASNADVLSKMTANYSTTDNNLALQWQDIALG
jgi:WXG100 family type VII secretion target